VTVEWSFACCEESEASVERFGACLAHICPFDNGERETGWMDISLQISVRNKPFKRSGKKCIGGEPDISYIKNGLPRLKNIFRWLYKDL
jgi:hypothetical protein